MFVDLLMSSGGLWTDEYSDTFHSVLLRVFEVYCVFVFSCSSCLSNVEI